MKFLNLLCLSFLLLQLTILAQEGWFWQHPLPQGNDLRDVFVLDENTIFAVGDRGTLLYSDNAGADWEITHRLADISENIVDIQFVSDQKGFLLANKYLLDDYWNFVYSSSKILFTEDSGMHWQLIAEFDSLRLNDLFFIDENIGWAVGYKGGSVGTLTGMVIKTADGGYNWDTLFAQVVFDQPRQDDKAISFSTIQFIDCKNGWAAGKSSSWGNTGDLLNTTDGGINWNVVGDPLNVISSFQFLNQNDAWLIEYSVNCGWGWYWYYSIKKTTDGGFNWDDVFTGSSNHYSTFSLPSLYFLNSDTGWVKQGDIQKTTDGGLSWVPVALHTPWNGAMHFSDEHNGCIVGKSGEILTTQSGGQSWIERSTMVTYEYSMESHFSAVHFYDENIGWASARGYHPYPAEGGWQFGKIFKTSDGGSTWIEQLYLYGGYGSSCPVNDVQATNDQIVYAVSSLVYKTSDGGTSWNYLNNLGWDSYSSLFFLNADSGFVGGGSLFKTANGGTTWDTVLSVSNTDIESIYFIDDFVGWTLCPSFYQAYIYKTMDGGETWQELLVSNLSLKSICFENENIGLAVGDDGIILRTLDGGFTWEEIWVKEGYELNSVAFSDYKKAIAVGREKGFVPNNGIIVSIDDVGGACSIQCESWTPILNDVYFLDDNNGWAVGDGGTIIKTGEGVSFVNEEEINEIPTNYSLSNNFPNPFNPSTKIRYSILEKSKVSIKVFDILGKEIETLVNEEKPTGTYEITWYAKNLPCGVYFYQLRTGELVETKKMILIK